MSRLASYVCPICHQPLIRVMASYRCQHNHSFDIAKEGYVNLLPVQYKHSKNPGDNNDMVNARRAFLDGGYYQPLRDKLVQWQQDKMPSGCIVDAGCGEGYYTAAHAAKNCSVYGVDIAKNAVRIAAKKYPDCHFSVASIAQLPFAEKSVDWLYSVYAPIKAEEFHRLLKDDGFFISVTPGKKHLWQLKQKIYDTPREHDETKDQIEGFALVTQERLSYTMTFADGGMARNLLAMTPFAFKGSATLSEQLANDHGFSCTADFLIRLYRKQLP
ncbi:23S rRNA (guanine(745)-N(1))-methyltransferase [Thalassotalea ponticola]|uniref:23S rRNA (guanine(745)-N(1))-methyltransferase n=1 Tax=Thalassotalea ponticola TaxID=1523392 RepID=UPI0025B626DA|nr:23S rRNA (guanine(745)-N(1))-methyltransferase [Thalassotalea ponticola]MDN3651246.1 23S rRNA (guanine(745)-N(1))-methyltransferase [Thalassotalea ponticola]